MRLKEREVTDREEIVEILSKALVGRVGLASGNQPYVVPVHFAYDDNRIFFHSANQGKKIEYLQVNPKVCFEVDDLLSIIDNPNPCSFDTKYRSVIAFGTARILTDKEASLQALRKILIKHGGKKESLTMDMIEKHVSSAGSKVDVIEIQIEKLTGKKSKL